jgi:hypothetical protein
MRVEDVREGTPIRLTDEGRAYLAGLLSELPLALGDECDDDEVLVVLGDTGAGFMVPAEYVEVVE